MLGTAAKHPLSLAIVSAALLVLGAYALYARQPLNMNDPGRDALTAADDGTVPHVSSASAQHATSSMSRIERAIADYLLTETRFSWKTRENSVNVCSVENLEPERELFPFAVWAYCGEYIFENGTIEGVSGSSGPVKVYYPNELSFYDPARFSFEAQGDGARYAADIRSIFSEVAQERIFTYDPERLVRENLEQAREKLDVRR